MTVLPPQEEEQSFVSRTEQGNEVLLCEQDFIPFVLTLSYYPNPSSLQRSKLKAHVGRKINLEEEIKLIAKPQEFYYVLMFEPLTWIVLLKYEK